MVNNGKITELRFRLREALDYKNMKPVNLCEKIGINKSSISRYLSGEMEPKADWLVLIAQALDVSEAWLAGYDVPRTVSEQKKDDVPSLGIIVERRNSPELTDAVSALSRLPEEQYTCFIRLLLSLGQE